MGTKIVHEMHAILNQLTLLILSGYFLPLMEPEGSLLFAIAHQWALSEAGQPSIHPHLKVIPANSNIIMWSSTRPPNGSVP
jgi:hypothetical protein